MMIAIINANGLEMDVTPPKAFVNFLGFITISQHRFLQQVCLGRRNGLH